MVIIVNQPTAVYILFVVWGMSASKISHANCFKDHLAFELFLNTLAALAICCN
eukprot:m.310549 g.310549  ORF g.310549 m.310549 type:complete len:53 (+) comp52515_c0_seq1:709-867(+)